MMLPTYVIFELCMSNREEALGSWQKIIGSWWKISGSGMGGEAMVGGISEQGDKAFLVVSNTLRCGPLPFQGAQFQDVIIPRPPSWLSGILLG